jgi:hypothetical protein
MMESESNPGTVTNVPSAAVSAKILTRREEINSGIPWVEKYRPQRYVYYWLFTRLLYQSHLFYPFQCILI